MSGSRNRGNDRFYSPPALRRHQQQMMMQREREMMFLQFQHQQQQQQAHMMMMMRHFEERERQRRLLQQQQQQFQEQQQVALRRESLVESAEAEERQPSEADSAFSVNSSMVRTNIDRLVETVMPCVPVRYLPQPRRNGQEAHEASLIQFFKLDDLWESYREWSAYGAGVELKLNGDENVTQYFVPSLSIIQLYVDPAAVRPGIDSISQKMNKMSISPSSSTSKSSQFRGKLVFEYQEREPPHLRKPLFDKISALAIGFSDLRKYRSCDLLPTSWISVAWYPIYRIPTGPSLKTLEASFLTFHHLSTPTSSRSAMEASASSKVVLPVFGLASYKLKSSILPLLDVEQKLSESLFESAKNWIEDLHVYHPDYNFFMRNGKPLEADPNQTKME